MYYDDEYIEGKRGIELMEASDGELGTHYDAVKNEYEFG